MDSGVDRRLILASAGLAGVAGVAALSRMAKGGPTDPPPGPISSTGKTLQQVYDRVARGGATASSEPRRCVRDLASSPTAQFVIDEPGAYYVDADITGEPGKCCIEIRCADVDVDGGGFTFHGAQGTLSCISVSPPAGVAVSNVELYDFAVHGWQGCSCDLSRASSCFVSDCSFFECVCPDDAVFGPGAVCRCGFGSEVCDCSVRSCTGSMIRCGPSSLIDGCSCVGSAGGGMRCADASTISDCFVVGNDAPAVAMIQSGARCLITDCDVRDCFGVAIAVGDSTDVECCSVTGGSGGAIFLGSDCTCEDSSVLHHTGSGITGLDRCCVDDCVVRSCGGAAVSVGSRSSIECSTCDECPVGFIMGDDSSCEDCDAHHIAGNGITGGAHSIACNCNCRLCEGWACAVGQGSTIDSCTCTGGGNANGLPGGGFSCPDGCCVDACCCEGTAGPSIQCGSRCTVSGSLCVQGGGIDAQAQCSIYDNECVECLNLQPFGGAIVVHGQRTCVENNYCSGGGILVLAGGDRCVIENNQCAGSESTVPGTGGGTIFIEPGVTGCHVVRNRNRGNSITSAFSIPPGNSFGPLANVSIGGDMSVVAASSHPQCNFVYGG